MYVKHRNVWTRDRGNHPPRSLHLQWPPPEPPTDCRRSRPPPGWALATVLVFSLEAQGLLLVPRPRSSITGPFSLLKILFSESLPWLLRSRRFSVFAFLPISFPLVTTGTKCFLVRKMLMILLSVWCVHGEKKKKLNTIEF